MQLAAAANGFALAMRRCWSTRVCPELRRPTSQGRVIPRRDDRRHPWHGVFKSESDDPRESLLLQAARFLEYESARVLCSDVYIQDPTFRTLEDVVELADVLVIGAPIESTESSSSRLRNGSSTSGISTAKVPCFRPRAKSRSNRLTGPCRRRPLRLRFPPWRRERFSLPDIPAGCVSPHFRADVGSHR